MGAFFTLETACGDVRGMQTCACSVDGMDRMSLGSRMSCGCLSSGPKMIANARISHVLCVESGSGGRQPILPDQASVPTQALRPRSSDMQFDCCSWDAKGSTFGIADRNQSVGRWFQGMDRRNATPVCRSWPWKPGDGRGGSAEANHVFWFKAPQSESSQRDFEVVTAPHVDGQWRIPWGRGMMSRTSATSDVRAAGA